MTSRVFFYDHSLVQTESGLWACEDIAGYPTMTLSELKNSLRASDEALSEQSMYTRSGKSMVKLGDGSSVALSKSTAGKLQNMERFHPELHRAVMRNKSTLIEALKVIL